MVFCDPLLLRGKGPDDFRGLSSGEGGFQNILAELRKIRNLEDYFQVSILAFAENHKRIHSNLSVIRFSSGTNPDTHFLLPFTKALWLGKWPRPGIYFSDRLSLWILRRLKRVGRLSHDFEKQEFGLLILPEVAEIRTKKKQTFAVEVPEMSDGQYFALSTPNCDYHSLPNHVSSHAALMAWLGIPKPFWKKGKSQTKDREGG